MAADDFISIEGIDKDVKSLLRALDELDRDVTQQVMYTAVDKAGQKLLAEQKRIISQRYPQFTDWLSMGVKSKQKKSYYVWCGYTTEIIREHIEVLIIEFGRPGKKGSVDKKGHKIGAIQPYSCVRASLLAKKAEVYDDMSDYIMSEITKIWEAK